MKTHFFKVVQAVALHGSFSEAAAILGCSQSNISYAIKEVEDFFEKRLFIRSRTGCTLTPEGKVITQTLGNIMATLEQLKKMGPAVPSPSTISPIFSKRVWIHHWISWPGFTRISI
ncbi:LysR family transcriptional regulator [Pseudomonas capsici]|uniref:helix-turn-helix domain-containing protein n=1 Tax=Pseudomonas capsici TaxID=2810614 RepID=UPI001A02BD22|nr:MULTISPECIES: LysR family transcriptional regulator [Pseudomonas]MCV4274596.1 LysR family transcriptional regulator [Pseudomonas capsici]GFM48914.1 LysR family transcriptional regulator [Pseudomonas cichorii]